MELIEQQFFALLQDHNQTLSETQLQQFDSYYRELIEWNEKMNLTAITERDQVYMKHFYDSLTLSFFFDLSKVNFLADIGSGAGFPSIPLKIAFPHLQVTIVDSLNKRIGFLRNLTDKLGLTGVNCVHGRAEDIARIPSYRDHFDLVTARAVAKLAVLNEFCLPFVKKGGSFLAMKGSEIEQEIVEAVYSLSELKGKFVFSEQLVLPMDQSKRHIIRIDKAAVTPAKYPRKAGIPLKAPLIKG